MGSLSPDSGPRPAARRRSSASSAEAPEPCALSVYREAVAAAIREEDHDVGSIVMGNVAWSRWPDRYRRLLMAAVTDEGEAMEAQKARALRRQLFRDIDPGWLPVSPATLSAGDCCAVERLRMALLGRTPLGCGRRLLDEELR